ncbi:TPA: hypothetical protein ACGO3K_002161 [Streptococcus suis]
MNKSLGAFMPPILTFILFLHWFFLGDFPIEIFKTKPYYLLILATILFLFVYFYKILLNYKDILLYNLYRYRYFVVIAIIVIGVLLELSGSSIGIWGDYLYSEQYDKVLFGVDRPVRSDEFATSTIWTFSQFSNTENLLPYFSQIVRGTKTDMFLLLNQPVFALPIIFKPAQWGYLILGMNKGLSFAWLVRFFMMFMSLFEMLMLVLKRDKTLAFLGASLISFGPAVQWWSMGPAEILTWGSVAVIIVYYYIHTKSYLKRIIFAILLSWVATAYAIVLYPAWQVPFLFVFLIISLYFIVSDWENMFFYWKKDIPIIISALFLTLIFLLLILNLSREVLQLTMQTVYPGARSSTGGGDYFYSFATGYPFSIWYPTLGLAEERGMNVFYDFFPLGMILSTYAWVKKKDGLLTVLLLLNIFFLTYIVAGIPNILAKISLLSFTISPRLITIFSFVNILLVLRSLVVLKKELSKRASLILSFVLTSISMLFAYNSTVDYISSSLIHDATNTLKVSIEKWLILLISYFVLFLAVHAVLSFNKQRFLKISLVIIFLSGVMVNPIRIGSDVIFKSNLVTNIKSITNLDNQSKWIVDSVGYPLTNIPLVAGAPTLNSTNAYPNLDLWRSLDDKGQYNDIYNRYAHVMIELTNSEDVSFELLYPDAFKVILPVSKLKDLNVKYLVSIRDLTVFNSENIHFELHSTADSYLIYKVEY